MEDGPTPRYGSKLLVVALVLVGVALLVGGEDRPGIVARLGAGHGIGAAPPDAIAPTATPATAQARPSSQRAGDSPSSPGTPDRRRGRRPIERHRPRLPQRQPTGSESAIRSRQPCASRSADPEPVRAPVGCIRMAQDDPPDASDAPDRSTRWAELRTDLAEDRNIMAMERTFAGWMRTAFAAIGIGLAFKAVFGAFDPPWLAKAIATLFVLAGGLLALSAQRRARHTLAKLSSHHMETPAMPNFRLLAYAVAVGAAILIAGLWILHEGTLTAG